MQATKDQQQHSNLRPQPAPATAAAKFTVAGVSPKNQLPDFQPEAHRRRRRFPPHPDSGEDDAEASVADVAATEDVLDDVGADEPADAVDRRRVVQDPDDDSVALQSHNCLRNVEH